jgi:hypothetical protein
MAFPSGSRDLTSGVPYDEALQLLFLAQPQNNFYQQGQVDYPPQPSSTTYRPLEHDYARVCAQTFSEDPPLQPPQQLGLGQQKEPHDLASVLHKLRSEISSIQTKCDNMGPGISSIQTKCDNMGPGISSIQTKCDNLEAGISWIQTKCNNLEATVLGLQNLYAFHQVHFRNITDRCGRTKTFINDVKEYIELHRAWSLIVKRAFESQNRQAAGSEDSECESQGN